MTLNGKTVVFTGSLLTMTRSEAKQIVERMGGFVAASISDKTSLVVTGVAASQIRLAAAERYNVKTIDENSFLSLLKQSDKDE